MDALFTSLPAGVHHVRHWLTLEQQRWIVARCLAWTRGPVPLHSPVIRGHPMSVRVQCLGWHWRPYRYGRRALDVNGARVPPVPDWLVRLGRLALAEAADPLLPEPGTFTPDVALINHYDSDARMGLHQDREELSAAPVVSISLGNTARFRLGNTETRNRPWTDLTLESGDLFIFGGPSRLAFHGVLGTVAGTAPEIGLPASGLARINITLRETGLAA